MSVLNNSGIVFHDKAGGGYYCNECKRYLHPDMVPSHKHTQGNDLAAANPRYQVQGNQIRPESPLQPEQPEIADIVKNLANWFRIYRGEALESQVFNDALSPSQAKAAIERLLHRSNLEAELKGLKKASNEKRCGCHVCDYIGDRTADLQQQLTDLEK